jgi:outer membrane usher protein FimD/PapC
MDLKATGDFKPQVPPDLFGAFVVHQQRMTLSAVSGDTAALAGRPGIPCLWHNKFQRF